MLRIYTLLLFVHVALSGSGQCWKKVTTAKQPGYSGHTLAIATDGTLWSFGSNRFGQLGDGTNTDRSFPVQVGTANDWVEVSATGGISYGIKADGTLWSWGTNFQGYALGDGTNVDRSVPMQVGTDTNWKAVTVEFATVVGLKTDGTIWRWGSDGFANGSRFGMITPLLLPVPTQLGTDTDWIAIDRGNTFTMALKSDGTRWGYGAFSDGVAGTGVAEVGSASLIKLDDGPWKAVAVGGHAVGIKNDGSLWAWGTNWGGQVGNGTNINPVTVPVLIDNSHTWKIVRTGYNVSAEAEVSFAIRDDNTLWAWGGGGPGRTQFLLGTGSPDPTNVPVQVGSATDWVGISGGGGHTAGIRGNNTLWTWGAVDAGQLGNGQTSNTGSYVLSPFQVECQKSLPVSLWQFTLARKAASVDLLWATASEKNASRFEVQRSTDAETWQVLGVQAARGESQSLVHYRLTDEHPLRGLNYYRLKMIDQDGTYTYSKVLSAGMERGGAILYPNPVAETLFLKNVEEATVREIVLRDSRGTVVFRSAGVPVAGIPVRTLPEGRYLLTVTEHSGFSKAYKVNVIR